MRKIYTKDDIKNEALKHKTKKDFFTKSPGFYCAAKRFGILREVCSHMPKRQPTGSKWSLEVLLNITKECSDRKEFAKKNRLAYRYAIKNGLLDSICSHMSVLRNKVVWTSEKIQQEALKYKTKTDFSNNSRTAYSYAQKAGMLDEVCSHMEVLWSKKWNKESLKKEALKYETRSDFTNGSSGAYDAARNLDVLDEICLHMKASSNVSKSEEELFSIIKEMNPNAKKLRDRNVKIAGKPHIKGFDVDIYVQSLNKGIEFDGEYWHSFEVMKSSRQKRHWPENDVLDYHKIKDEYFLSKGIQILHVKEEDWIKDKQSCVDKCLEFLGEQNAN